MGLLQCFFLFLLQPGQLRFNITCPRVLFHNGFIRQNTNGFGTIFNGFRFIDQNIPVEHDLKINTFKVTHPPVAEILINEPKQLFKSGLKFSFHTVCIQINVRIHGLNVHLVWIAAHAFILGIITAGVLDQGLFEHFQNGLVIFGVDFHR